MATSTKIPHRFWRVPSFLLLLWIVALWIKIWCECQAASMGIGGRFFCTVNEGMNTNLNKHLTIQTARQEGKDEGKGEED